MCFQRLWSWEDSVVINGAPRAPEKITQSHWCQHWDVRFGRGFRRAGWLRRIVRLFGAREIVTAGGEWWAVVVECSWAKFISSWPSHSIAWVSPSSTPALSPSQSPQSTPLFHSDPSRKPSRSSLSTESSSILNPVSSQVLLHHQLEIPTTHKDYR